MGKKLPLNLGIFNSVKVFLEVILHDQLSLINYR